MAGDVYCGNRGLDISSTPCLIAIRQMQNEFALL